MNPQHPTHSPILLSSKRGKWVSHRLQPLINWQELRETLVWRTPPNAVPRLGKKEHHDQLAASAISTGLSANWSTRDTLG